MILSVQAEKNTGIVLIFKTIYEHVSWECDIYMTIT